MIACLQGRKDGSHGYFGAPETNRFSCVSEGDPPMLKNRHKNTRALDPLLRPSDTILNTILDQILRITHDSGSRLQTTGGGKTKKLQPLNHTSFPEANNSRKNKKKEREGEDKTRQDTKRARPGPFMRVLDAGCVL